MNRIYRKSTMSKSTKSLFLSSGLALAIMSMGQPALAQTAGESLTDVRQEVQIWTTYALNPYLRANDLKVTVKDGKATLTGFVPEGVNKELAKEIALGVNGIKEVDNQIVVDGEKPVTNAAPVGSYGEVIDDATITVAVKSKLLWSKHTDSLKTTVETKSGRVTLSGTADSAAARDLAGRLAANTRGVISVRNMLEVVPAVKAAAATTSTVTGAPAGSVLPQVSTAKAEQAVSDTWITTKVKSTLLYSSNVSGADITVTTVAGVVTLKGKLDSGAERALAIELAQNVKGVKSVNAKDVTF
jgi:osmotically-inducible protein OsmY